MSTRLCFDFLRHADWVWRRIAVAEDQGFPFSEETITETVLLDLKVHHPNSLFIQPFSKHQESWNGADWEWWIGRDGNWLGMRVQAKRISLPSERFKSLFYKAKRNPKPQIEHLIEKAQSAGLVPIYTLYTHSSDEAVLKSQVQHCFASSQPSLHECGCLVAHAQDIEAIGSLRLSEIAHLSFPWHWLVCNCIVSSNDPSRPADFVSDLLRRSESEVLRDRPERQIPEPRERLPDHIEALRFEDETGKREEILDRHMKKWDLGGAALFDLGTGEDE